MGAHKRFRLKSTLDGLYSSREVFKNTPQILNLHFEIREQKLLYYITNQINLPKVLQNHQIESLNYFQDNRRNGRPPSSAGNKYDVVKKYGVAI